MSFEVVASSRIEERQIAPWRYTVQTGLQLGLLGIFVAVVGILGMFNKRPIIVGELTLGYATLGLTFFLAGILVARRRLFPTARQTLLASLTAGAIAAAVFALLPIVMSFVNLRSIFVSLDNNIYKMLTFGFSPAIGIALLLCLGAISGFLGALLMVLPDPVRGPIAGGLTAAGVAGLFQELIRPILANSRTTKPIHDLLYTWTGMTLRGAIIIFLLVAAGIVLWRMSRERVLSNFNRISPAGQYRIRWGFIAAAIVLA
ncbi:MAG: hypothetical protein ACREDW_05905, partial [Aestuariivirgaceae bacterium]